MENREKIFRYVLLMLLVVVSLYNLGKGARFLSDEQKEKLNVILGQTYVEVGKKGLESYAPAVLCEKEDLEKGQDFVSAVVAKAKSYVGILGMQPANGKEEKVESAKTSQEIIEANANAIAASVLAENQADAIKQENDAAKEPEQPAEVPVEEDEKKDLIVEATAKVTDISKESLEDFNVLKNTFFTVDSTTEVTSEQLNVDKLLGKDLSLKQDNSQPQILIYHTHSQEGYVDSTKGDPSTTIVGLGDYLTTILREQYGYNVIHITQEFDMVTGVEDRNKAYNYARDSIAKVLEENPTVEVVIDLHRDGVNEDRHLVTQVNGKQTAKIMFFNGLSYSARNGPVEALPNPYIEDNLAFSFRMGYLAAQYYPEFVRTNYLKYLRYNLDLRPKSLLLECGAQTNTFEEAKNAIDAFTDIFHKVLNGA